VRTDAGELWFPDDDKVMLPYIQSTGTWEPTEGALLRPLLRPDTRFLDVGANVGYFSAFVARECPHGTIDAVEPDARNVALLRMNMWQHAPHARIHPVALGNTRAVAALRLDAVNYGNTRIGGDSAATQLAALIPGDELFAGRVFDVVKIDVQGYELEVMQGLQRTLRASERVAVVVEFFPEAIKDRGLRPLDVLAQYRGMGFERVACVAGKLARLDDDAVLAVCRDAGADGFVNLLLRR
jgi:FkbM family methyltransferase